MQRSGKVDMGYGMESLNLKIGERLKKIRTARQLTLDEVSGITRVSKPMLGQIERGQSVPTVTTLWKIATGLKVPLSSFLEEAQAEYALATPEESQVMLGDEGRMRAYPMFTYDPMRSVETFYIEFDEGCCHQSDRHSDGVEEHVFVLKGTLLLIFGENRVEVREKQAIRFRADFPHAYHNISDGECVIYNTIFYPDAVIYG